MTRDWHDDALRELLDLSSGTSRWGYRKGAVASVEPTALAGLALLASGSEAERGDVSDAVKGAASWLASIQASDGSLGIAAGQPTPGWTTPYGILLWKALGVYENERRRAIRWLLRTAGKPLPKESDPEHIVGHDTTLIGWPWVTNTHSWLEPTALAILALHREGFDANDRTKEGRRVIVDRAIAGGGWNYGNKAAFGHDLRAQPAPTGLALLALASGGGRPEVVKEAIGYLKATLPQTRAPASLGWGLLGLSAWNERPKEAAGWLAYAYRETTGRPDAAPRLAILLLADGARALEILAGNEGGRHD